MAKQRNYKREYQNRKRNNKASDPLVGVHVPSQVFVDFEQRCFQNGVTRNAVLRYYIKRYTYEGFDQTPPPVKETATPPGMLPMSKWAARQGITRQRASMLVKEGHIPGAIQKGRYWYIPEDFVWEKWHKSQ